MCLHLVSRAFPIPIQIRHSNCFISIGNSWHILMSRQVQPAVFNLRPRIQGITASKRLRNESRRISMIIPYMEKTHGERIMGHRVTGFAFLSPQRFARKEHRLRSTLRHVQRPKWLILRAWFGPISGKVLEEEETRETRQTCSKPSSIVSP